MKKTALLALCSSINILASADVFQETLYPSWGQSFAIEEILHEDQTEHQDLIVFSNEKFGTCLALDGAMQVTENDEFFYHEAFVNIPYYTHGNVSSVLVIGGGDGGIIRELMRHKDIQRVVLVELDEEVVTFSKKHLPFLSQGAFEDSRLSLHIADGATYIKQSDEQFDLILIDSPDPVGEALSLFTKEFYKDCQKHLKEGGIFVNQAGVPFMQPDELQLVSRGLKGAFTHSRFFYSTIPTYAGGQMAFGFASDSDYRMKTKEIAQRIKKEGLSFRYYNAKVHKASFASSEYIINLLKENKKQ